MGIDMSAYKMVYKDRVYNCLSMMITWGGNDPNDVQALEVVYIDNNNRIAIVKDQTTEFQFIIR